MAYKLTNQGTVEAQKIGKPYDAKTATLVYLLEHKDEPIGIEELIGELRTIGIKELKAINSLLEEKKIQEVV